MLKTWLYKVSKFMWLFFCFPLFVFLSVFQRSSKGLSLLLSFSCVWKPCHAKSVPISSISHSLSTVCVSAAFKYLGSSCMSRMLNYSSHLAWTQASGAWSIHCSTWVKVIECSPSLLRSPMSKHMAMEHLEHVWVTRTTWPQLPQQKRLRRWRRFELTLL